MILQGKETRSARLIDNAYQVLQKHAAKIQDAEALGIAVQELRAISGVASGKASLGEQKRQAGGLALRTGTRPPPNKPPPPGVQQAA